METQPTIIAPDGSTDLTTQLPDINSMMSSFLGPVMWLSIAFTVLFAILYVFSMARRRKVEKAILDIQKTLHEMNERDKSRLTPSSTEPRPEPAGDTIIAANDKIVS